MMPDAPYIGYVVSHTRDAGWHALAVRWQRPESKTVLYPYTDLGRKVAERVAADNNHRDYLGL